MAAENIEALRSEVDKLNLREQEAELEYSIRLYEQLRRMCNEAFELPGFPDKFSTSDPPMAGNDPSVFGYYSSGTDRRDGDYAPIFVSEFDHQAIRGACRDIAQFPIAAGLLESLGNYVVGDGFQYAAAAKEQFKTDQQTLDLAKAAQNIVNETLDASDWWAECEHDLVTEGQTDGEKFVAVEPQGNRRTRLQMIPPEFVTEPRYQNHWEMDQRLGLNNYEPLNWKYGIATDPGRQWHVRGVYVEWNGDQRDWQVFKATQIEHLKLNVPKQTVKRGLSDFFSPRKTILRAEKLLTNTMIGSATQAAIAGVRQHAQGTTRKDLAAFVARQAEAIKRRLAPSGKMMSENIASIPPGTVVDTMSGTLWSDGPTGGGTRSKVYLDVVQGGLRIAGTRWNSPEYMTSGDASNANYASTLVAESPYMQATIHRQRRYTYFMRRVLWKVLLYACIQGRLPVTYGELRQRLEIVVTATPVVARNKKEEHEINKSQNAAGLLSDNSWAAREGIDLADEKTKGARPKLQAGSEGEGGGTSGGVRPDPAIEPNEPPADDAAPAPDQVLTGIQIQSANQIIRDVAAGLIDRNSGLAQLEFFFKMPPDIAERVMGRAGMDPPSPALLQAQRVAESFARYQ